MKDWQNYEASLCLSDISYGLYERVDDDQFIADVETWVNYKFLLLYKRKPSRQKLPVHVSADLHPQTQDRLLPNHHPNVQQYNAQQSILSGIRAKRNEIFCREAGFGE